MSVIFNSRGNGFLSLLSGEGDVIDWRVLEGLDSPLGMTMSGDRLYLVDNNHLKVFSWPDYQLLKMVLRLNRVEHCRSHRLVVH